MEGYDRNKSVVLEWNSENVSSQTNRKAELREETQTDASGRGIINTTVRKNLLQSLKFKVV